MVRDVLDPTQLIPRDGNCVVGGIRGDAPLTYVIYPYVRGSERFVGGSSQENVGETRTKMRRVEVKIECI
ncbi:hypothetical protein EBT31_17840 [bacterium]|nr:hypothetical protein [bacterium]